MAYAVRELFYTLQGEGGNAGRAAVFRRFAGCNPPPQPMDAPRQAETAAAMAHCLAHPRWRLGLQTHKLLGIP